MGTPSSIAQVIQKFDNIFGNILPPEVLLEKYYSARQHQNETAAAWACRLEDVLSQLCTRDPSSRQQTERMIRSKFWSGLRDSNTKNALRHQYQIGAGLEELLVAARVMEEELKVPMTAQSQPLTTQQAPYEQILAELAKLNKRMDQIEGQKTSASRSMATANFPFRGKCFKCQQRGHRQTDCPEN